QARDSIQKQVQELLQMQKKIQELEQQQKLAVIRVSKVINILSSILDERQNEEWVGDVYAMRSKLYKNGYPLWKIRLLTTYIASRLLISRVQCMIHDRFSRRYGKP